MVLGLVVPSAPSSISTKTPLLLRSSFRGVRLSLSAPKQLPSTRFRSSAAPIRMMAKRAEELKEIRTMSTEAINEAVVELKGELLMLRLQRSVKKEVKTSEFRRMRKKIARMLTVKREREVEEGIGKRMSRKLDREWKKNIVVKPPPSLRRMIEEQKEKKAAEAKKSS